MVSFKTRFFFSAIYLFTQVSYLMAGKCCADDPHCSGCWMCTGSDLRNCWDAAVIEADACSKQLDLSKQVECLCASYGKIAYCWSKGVCCTEYAPTLSAATNLCNLKTYPADQLTKDMVERAANDAYNVRNTIWHNDSGYNVPKLSVYVKTYSSDFSSPAVNNLINSSTNSKSNINPPVGSQTKSLKSEKNAPSATKVQNIQAQGQNSGITKPKTSSTKASRQRKCSRGKHKAQRHLFDQSLGKREERDLSSRPNPKNAEIWKRSQMLNSSGQPICGIDFHGVAYPSQVPQSVASVFSTL